MTKECLPCKIQTSSLGQRSIPIQIPRGFAPRDLDWNWDLCPRDSVWILQGKHSFVIGFLHGDIAQKLRNQEGGP